MSVFYIYIWDTRIGPGFIKICTYFPYPVKAWGSTGMSGPSGRPLAGPGASLSCPTGSRPAETRPRCSRSATASARAPSRCGSSGGCARLPLPLGTADRDAGYWWELSMRQVETSRTLVFTSRRPRPRVLRGAAVREHGPGPPGKRRAPVRRGQVRRGPQRAPGGTFKTRIDQYCSLVTMNINYKNSRLKQYLNYLQP